MAERITKEELEEVVVGLYSELSRMAQIIQVLSNQLITLTSQVNVAPAQPSVWPPHLDTAPMETDEEIQAHLEK